MNNELSKDLELKAKWVSDLMAADKVKPEQITDELCLAYMDTIGKKIEQIQSIYLTRDGAKNAMDNFILECG